MLCGSGPELAAGRDACRGCVAQGQSGRAHLSGGAAQARLVIIVPFSFTTLFSIPFSLLSAFVTEFYCYLIFIMVLPHLKTAKTIYIQCVLEWLINYQRYQRVKMRS